MILNDFLLELLSEEIPARMQARARNDLAKLFAEALAKAGLSHGAIDVWSTPRRLALIARDVPGETEAVREEVKGPRASAPAQALEGFLRKTGLSQDQLEERDGVWFAVIDKPGRPAADVLGEAVAAIIRDFPWPKSMRWGPASASMSALRWVRPLHSIVAILGEEIVPVAVDGVTCSATTLGHRFHHPGPIPIGGASDYAEKLRACHVIVDQEERETIVREGARAAAGAAGFALVEDEGLVVENAGLTEWPVPLLGTFDPDFLDVPPEVIQLTARTNQKYFVMRREDGSLAPAFVCTANIAASDGGKSIVEGNRRVLAARLSDARFFWEQDVKVPLDEQAAKLSGIVFHEKLGTVADKVERVAKLARWLVEEGIVGTSLSRSDGEGDRSPQANGGGARAEPSLAPPSAAGAAATSPSLRDREVLAHLAERAARLAKADLVTGMVGEFPELQGVIGGYLAAAQGEPRAVSDASRTIYTLDAREPVAVAVALADRIDSVMSFFAIGEKPTGSRDPFGVRRAGLGIVYYLLTRSICLDMRALAGDEVFDFLVERWKFQNREAGGRPDLIDAVISGDKSGDLVRLGALMRALEEFVETGEGKNLLAGYKRAANILRKEGALDDRHPGLDPGPALSSAEGTRVPGQARDDDAGPAEEAALLAGLGETEARAESAIAAEDFTAAMTALASLRAPIDAFFEKVIVNDPDPATRARRLALLARFRDAVHRVADFSKIEG